MTTATTPGRARRRGTCRSGGTTARGWSLKRSAPWSIPRRGHVGDERLLAEGHAPGRRSGRPGRRRPAAGRRLAVGAGRPSPRRPGRDAPRSRRRPSRSRCSGRGCRPARGRSPRGRAPARGASSPSAFITIPGEQKPHWLAPVAMNASAQAARTSRREPLERHDLATRAPVGVAGRTRPPGGRPPARCRPRTIPRVRSRPSSSGGRSARGAARAGWCPVRPPSRPAGRSE